MGRVKRHFARKWRGCGPSWTCSHRCGPFWCLPLGLSLTHPPLSLDRRGRAHTGGGPFGVSPWASPSPTHPSLCAVVDVLTQVGGPLNPSRWASPSPTRPSPCTNTLPPSYRPHIPSFPLSHTPKTSASGGRWTTYPPPCCAQVRPPSAPPPEPPPHPLVSPPGLSLTHSSLPLGLSLAHLFAAPRASPGLLAGVFRGHASRDRFAPLPGAMRCVWVDWVFCVWVVGLC